MWQVYTTSFLTPLYNEEQSPQNSTFLVLKASIYGHHSRIQGSHLLSPPRPLPSRPPLQRSASIPKRKDIEALYSVKNNKQGLNLISSPSASKTALSTMVDCSKHRIDTKKGNMLRTWVRHTSGSNPSHKKGERWVRRRVFIWAQLDASSLRTCTVVPRLDWVAALTVGRRTNENRFACRHADTQVRMFFQRQFSIWIETWSFISFIPQDPFCTCLAFVTRNKAMVT